MTTEDRRRRVVTAWIEAMDAACQAVCHRRGSGPIDNAATLTPEQYNLAWEANTALSAGVVALAEAAARHGLDWQEILEMALQERDESYQHRAMPAPRGR